VIDGDIGGPLFKVLHRIATIAHHRGHKAVGVDHCSTGLIDEPLLQLLPFVAISTLAGGVELVNVEMLSTPFAFE
jgi:hypothetical protein